MIKDLSIHLIILLSIVSYSYGQKLVYDSEVLSENIGVSGLEVEQTFMDAKGRIWIKTGLALNLVYNIDDVTSFNSVENGLRTRKKIKKFVNDDNGVKIYYKGEGTFYDRYDDNTKLIDSIPIRIPFEKDTFISYTVTPNEIVWQLYRSPSNEKTLYNIGSKVQLKLIELSELKIIKSCASNDLFYFMSENFDIFIYNKDGVFKQKIEAPKFNQESKVKFNQVDNVFHIDNQNRFWVSYPGYKGVYKFENNELKISSKLPTDKLYVFVWEDSKNRLIFSSSERFQFTHDFFLLDEKNQMIPYTELFDYTYFATNIMSMDFKSYLFLSSYRGLQLLKLKPEFQRFDIKESKEAAGKYGNINRGLIETKDGSIFIFRENDFRYKYNKKKRKAEKIPFKGNPKTVTANSKYYESLDKIYSQTYEAGESGYQIIELDPTNNKSKKLKLDYGVHSFEMINDSTLIIIVTDLKKTFFRIYYDINKNLITSKSELQYSPLKEYSIRELLYDKNLNRLWILDGYLGVFYQNLDDIKKEIHPFVLNENKKLANEIFDVSLGKSNELHLSTDNGFYIIDKQTGKTIKHLTKEDGLKSMTIMASVYSNNFIWITSSFGLYVFNIETNNLKSYFAYDGLPDNEFNNRIKQLSPNGNICFGTANGAIMINPNIYLNKERESNIFTKDIKVQFNSILKKLSFTSNQESEIYFDQFHYIDIHLYNDEWKSSQGYQYKYILNGKEYTTKSNQIRIDKLKLGTNTISIQGNSYRNIPSKNTLTYTIHTKLPIYKTSWFKTLLLLLLAGAIYYFVNLRMDSIKREKENVQLNFQKRISQLELMALQSQMNPHFIFNAINAIQDFLWDNEKADVEAYLNDFSRLMRLYLESSKTKSITLESEIEMLQLYSKLEKLRFSDKFDLKINVDDNVEPKYLRLPTMLLQPFVENAINHGIFHKKGNGQIDIDIHHKNKNLIITIKDDGIGRTKSKEIKNKSIYNYKSRAIQITEERINVLKEYENIEIKIDIQDLYDTKNIGIGTRVTIVIPEEN